MRLVVNGKFYPNWDGGDVETTELRDWVTKDGLSGFKAESGRYHLYVSWACPWAHRTIIFRQLKQLESHIGMSIVSPNMFDNGWVFDKKTGSSGDALFDVDCMHEIYTKSHSDYTGRVSVPVLWDKKTNTIVSNESSEIIRMFNDAFDDITGSKDDFYPEVLRKKIDEINTFIFEYINIGVYKCGFATTQEAYDEAYPNLFAALDRIEEILSKNRYLVGDQITEADWRLFTTLIRFDEVYHGHFKCNKQRIEEYPNLSNYRRELYQYSGIKETVDFEHIKRHYYYSHTNINPTQIIPKGPEIDYDRPHHRK